MSSEDGEGLQRKDVRSSVLFGNRTLSFLVELTVPKRQKEEGDEVKMTAYGATWAVLGWGSIFLIGYSVSSLFPASDSAPLALSEDPEL